MKISSPPKSSACAQGNWRHDAYLIGQIEILQRFVYPVFVHLCETHFKLISFQYDASDDEHSSTTDFKT
jgi:hypothetical protein